MTRKEASERFNSLPVEHRITIIANDLEQQIRWLESEKRNAIKLHSSNIKNYNEKIKSLEKWLFNLKD